MSGNCYYCGCDPDHQPKVIATLRSRVEELTKALREIHQFPYVGFNALRQMALIAGSALPLDKSGGAT